MDDLDARPAGAERPAHPLLGDIQIALAGRIDAGQDRGQHRLARPTSPSQPDHFARRDLEAHLLEHRQRAEAFREIDAAEDWFHLFLSAVSYQLSAVSYQLAAISCRTTDS